MSKEIEAKVLAAVLNDRYLLSKLVTEGFNADVFLDPNFKLVYRMLAEMTQMPGQVIDWITIETALRRKEWFTPEVAQALELVKSQEIVQADQVMAYVEIMKDQGLREKMMKLSLIMANYCQHKGPYKDQDYVEFSSRIVQSLIELQKQKVKKRLTPLTETIREIDNLTDQVNRDSRKLLGFSVEPFVRLQQVLSGIRKGFYYGLAGPPRRGKTTFGLGHGFQAG